MTPQQKQINRIYNLILLACLLWSFLFAPGWPALFLKIGYEKYQQMMDCGTPGCF
jgi:hypothetical protein